MPAAAAAAIFICVACLLWSPCTVEAAFKCDVCGSAPAASQDGSEKSGDSSSATSSTFCPLNSWYVCLDAATPDHTWISADSAARSHYLATIRRLTDVSVPVSKACRAALQSWICASHFPVCEASTHGRGICDSQFRVTTEQCPEIFADVSTSTAAAAAAAAATSRNSKHNATEVAQEIESELAAPGTKNGSVVSENQGSCFHLDYSGPNYWNWVIGFALCTVFAALSPLAFNLQKSSIMNNDALPLHKQVPVYRQPKWMCGVVVLISCSLVDFVAFGLAPQSLLTPLGAMVLVYNMIIASFYGEKVGRVEMVATGVISVGTLLCIVFADHYTPSYSFSDILSLWYTSRMLWYIILVPIFAAAHAIPARWIVKNGLHEHPVDGPHYARLLCICYAGAAGIIGAQAILFAKQTMELLKAWGLGEPIWAHYEVYLILIGIPVGLIGNLSFLNRALAMFDALQVVPIYQTYWMIAGTLGGFVYFDELEEMDALSKGMFFLGALISLVGIGILSSRRQPGGSGGAEGDEQYGRVLGDDSDDSGSRSSLESGDSDSNFTGGSDNDSNGDAHTDEDLENCVELSSSVKATLNDLGVSTEKKKKKKRKRKKKKKSERDGKHRDGQDEESDKEGSSKGGDGRSRSPSDAVMVRRVSGAFVLTMSDSDCGSEPSHSPRSTGGKRPTTRSFEALSTLEDTAEDTKEQ